MSHTRAAAAALFSFFLQTRNRFRASFFIYGAYAGRAYRLIGNHSCGRAAVIFFQIKMFICCQLSLSLRTK